MLNIVNEVLTRNNACKYTKKTVYPYFHPNGIKEMAESRGLRIAHAIIHLLEFLEVGGINDRLSALRSLRDEVLNTTGGILPKNTARVLLQIMKELVRAHGNYRRQLELAHDFRTTATGNPRIIRAQLRRYHLLEMPEEWNQITFDDHVHDANTKGRKSSSHLIMDAWIKGIKRLRVVYYNHLEPRFVVELLEAGEIIGITIRIGIEFPATFYKKYAQLIWVPRGFSDSKSFLSFLAEKSVSAFMADGRKVSEYQQRFVMAMFQEFNEKHYHDINETYGIDLCPLNKSAFLSFVGTGQASLLHLAKFIHAEILLAMDARITVLRDRYVQANPEERRKIEDRVKNMNKLDSDAILKRYLQPAKNPEIPDPNIPCDLPGVPDMLKLSPYELIEKLTRLHSAFHITLNLSNLKVEDVLEILYDCNGMITRLEIFNLKDYAAGKTTHLAEINRLQQAINDGNVISLKHIIRKIIARLEASDAARKDNRIEKLLNILHDIITLKDLYKGTVLKARIGSDSTGRSARVHGMGLAIKETLPQRAQKEIKSSVPPLREIIPIRIKAFRRITCIPRISPNASGNTFYNLIRRIPILRMIGEERHEDWIIQESSIHMESPGNIVTLGGIQPESDNGLSLDSPETEEKTRKVSLQYLNSGLKNGLKVFIGFVPAFATFALTKDWWLLAYFGAFIWFGITGLRNILQSVLGGGGIRRSPLLRWNDYVSWTRITDSLLFTGFSVPLLDYVIKTVVLDRFLGITTTTNPAALYGFMALANGIYISTHNVFRGLSRGAVLGNFFRSILSIPIAIGFNAATGGILGYIGFTGIDDILQKWAAIISKAASDFIAGIIEGSADRYHNIRKRLREYNTKLEQLFDIYAQLELLFPEVKVLQLLESPELIGQNRNAEVRDLEKIMLINALDLLYFWMYQPRARIALRRILKTISDEERQILIKSQFILKQQEEISLLFVDGLIGKNFSKPLSFYLDYSKEYLKAIKKIAQSEINLQII